MAEGSASDLPTISVVMPAYNQGEFLVQAIRSVLAQTVAAFEILVVDDGSTDHTAEVITSFGSRIASLRQPNQGLAAARNSGIRRAGGDFIALLDADDVWATTYLETMRSAFSVEPAADAFYSAAQCMDAQGHDLPQLAGASVMPPGQLYRALLRANFLIPSTMILRRSMLCGAGYFDEENQAIHGCEDWDLWLRLASTHRFIGLNECLVRYRLHATSMSANAEDMRRAMWAVVEKHFGSDDGNPASWSAAKRRAYGGLYRQNALSALLRKGDWAECADEFKRALAADPTLAEDVDMFYELALGTQPLGWRGTTEGLDSAANAVEVERLLGRAFRPPQPRGVAQLQSTAYATAFGALARVAWLSGERLLSRRYLLQAAQYRRRMMARPDWWRGLLRTLLVARASKFADST